MKKSPYSIIQNRHITEKTKVLESLKRKDNNPSLRRCEAPKYVFIVDIHANKRDISDAVESIYPNVQVTSVNTIRTQPKRRRVRGKIGYTKRQKKAIVTLTPGDTLGDDEEV